MKKIATEPMSPYFETCFSERGRVGRGEREQLGEIGREGERDKGLMAREREALGEKNLTKKVHFTNCLSQRTDLLQPGCGS